VTLNALVQCSVFFVVLLALVPPLGWYMARVFEGGPRAGGAPLGVGRVLGSMERGIYRLCGVTGWKGMKGAAADEGGRGGAGEAKGDEGGAGDAEGGGAGEMTWVRYAAGLLAVNVIGLVFMYVLQRVQHVLPLGMMNRAPLPEITPDAAFNAATSFVTNTNWQSYSGETSLSSLTQMLGMGVQNFLSAATGIAALVAVSRGLARRSCRTIGSCWVDLTRATLYVLLPLSLVLAVVLVSQGVVQSFRPAQVVSLVAGTGTAGGEANRGTGSSESGASTQLIPLGPAASQIAIKQLGTNGGGFFGVNSAHPFENPTALSNFLEMLAILLIPAALCWTFGVMVGDRRQGAAVLAAMLIIFIPMVVGATVLEQRGNPALTVLGVDQSAREGTAASAERAGPAGGASAAQAGGNMEGKEARFGVVNSTLWATATSAASNGSVNAMHDSFTPLGGLVPLALIQLGEVVFGGVGCGLYGMLMFVIIAVFAAGLMVGRTPEYLGKKIEPFEMKMAMIAVLLPCGLILLGTAAAVMIPEAAAGASNPGPHGFTQILYAFSSAANNNGSAFAGLSANTPFYNVSLGVCMWLSRFGVMIPALAIAGAMAGKRRVPTTQGTLPTHTPTFVMMLVAVVVLVGALTFVPALCLGPVAEHLGQGAGAGARLVGE